VEGISQTKTRYTVDVLYILILAGQQYRDVLESGVSGNALHSRTIIYDS
jgi:hypothetical protein